MARHILLSTALVVCCQSSLHADYSHDKQQPNIIFFIVDDMGWQDTSLPFWRTKTGQAKPTFLNQRYKTPHMEALASEGMMLTRAYACPVSTPSRVSLMTGMNAARHRVTNWTLNCDASTDTPHPTLQAPQWNLNGLQPQGTKAKGKTKLAISEESASYTMKKPFYSARPLPEYLRDAGYITIHCGKGHWGTAGTPGANPRLLGFDYNIAGRETGGIADYRGKHGYGQGRFQVKGLRHMEKYRKENTFATEALTLEAMELLDELKAGAKGRPFYLYMSHYAIHSPLDERANDPRFMSQYPAPHLKTHPKDGKPWNLKERNYATLIQGMDKSLGDLRSWLKANKLDDNTVIIFVSDNGGLAISGRLEEANYPLRYGKGSLYEGGIRVPAIVKWPGVTTGGSISARPTIIEDFFPTLLDIAKRPQKKCDGVSLLPTLRGKSEDSAVRPLLFHQPNQWGEGMQSGWGYRMRSALILGEWKLIYDHETLQMELYNLDDDIGEEKNLAKQHPAKLQQLSSLMKRELRQRKAQMPLSKETSKPVALPK